MTKTENAQKRLDTATAALDAAKERVETAKNAFTAARDKASLAAAKAALADGELDIELAEREVTDAQAELERAELATKEAELAELLPRCDTAAVMEPHLVALEQIHERLATIHDDALAALRQLHADQERAAGLITAVGSTVRVTPIRYPHQSPRQAIREMLERRVHVDERTYLLPRLDRTMSRNSWTRLPPRASRASSASEQPSESAAAE